MYDVFEPLRELTDTLGGEGGTVGSGGKCGGWGRENCAGVGVGSIGFNYQCIPTFILCYIPLFHPP